MPDINTTNAAPASDVNGGSDIERAASAFETMLSGDRQESEQGTEAPQPKKPKAGKKAKADEPTEREEDEDESFESSDEDGDEGQESEDDESEDESDEPEAEESEEDDEAEEGEEDEDEEEEEPVYAVTVDGQEMEVPLSELVRGYSRTADYTRKTQALAAERQQFHGEVQQTRALRDQYAQGLQQLQGLIQQSVPQEPNWDHLRVHDPIEFAAQWAEHQQRQQHMARINAERQALMQQRAEEEAQERATALANARNWLMERVPEWRDPAKAKAERAAIKAFGLEQGFSAEELREIDDPRAILILRMAMRHARASKKAQEVVKTGGKKPGAPKAPVLKPGAAKPPLQRRKASDLTRAKQRLAKDHSVDAAAEVFKSLI